MHGRLRAAGLIGASCGASWLAATTPATAGLQQIVRSSEEAVDRGLVYEMMGYPQQQGLTGFGCGFSDLDADGDPDIILLGAPDGHVGIFENDGTGHFTDRSALNGIPLMTQASAFAAGDINGDGLPEIYITQMAAPNVLVRNDGNFQFTDISAAAGVADNGAGMAPNFGDYDGDTKLDLYVCNYNSAVPGTEDIDNKLYRNFGAWTFVETGELLGVNDHGYGFQAVWFDFDLDDDLDLYLSNDRGHQPPLFRSNQLWVNDGGQFTNVSASSGAGVAMFSMGLACGDFDGNGLSDIYVTNIAGYEDGYNPLLLNESFDTPRFIEASQAMGVDHWISSWGSIFYDFDNNGHLDLYVNNMFEANSLYLSDGNFPCFNLAADAGVEANSGISFGSAVADVDLDGDVDLLVNNLEANVELFINLDGETRGWAQFRMVGEGGNPNAVGGRINARVAGSWKLREIYAGGNGYLGQNELLIHLGVGQATLIDEMVVTWPSGAGERTLTNLPANRRWTLYPASRLGDADGDGQVLLNDFVVLVQCAGAPYGPGCEMMDFDGNSVLDTADRDAFVAAFDGPVYDCDENQRADLFDIFDDPTLDLDGTGVLDECESGGDLNGDGKVDTLDFLLLLSAWGPCDGACPADLNDDGVVDTTDFLQLLASWG